MTMTNENAHLMALAEKLPAPFKDNARALVTKMSTVIEGIGDEGVHWKPGFLRLVQGTTDRSSIPKGTAIGDMVIGETRIEAPLFFYPIRLFKERQLWDPDQNNAKMLCNSPDAKMGYIGIECKACPKSKWVDGEGTECNQVISLLAITADLTDIFKITFSKSGYKVGVELEGLMKKAGVEPYKRKYGLSSTTNPNAKNVEMFKIELPDAAARKAPEDVLGFLKALFDQVSSDRTKMLTSFYEAAARRTGQMTLPGMETVKITDESGEKVEGVSDATLIEGKVSELATSYKL